MAQPTRLWVVPVGDSSRLMPTSAAEVVFDKATKLYPGRPEPAVDDLSLTVPAGRDLRPRRTVGQRQDDGAEARQPADLPDRGRDPHRRHEDLRPRHHGAAAKHRLRHPAGRPVPAHDRRGERRHRAAAARLAEAADPRAHRRAARARRPRSGRRTGRATRRSSRAASGSASASRARSRPIRR